MERMAWLWKLLGDLVIVIMLLNMAISAKDEHAKSQVNEKLPSLENTTAYRLPENVIPNTYYIRITPFIETNNFTFDGVVRIIANVTKKTSNIVLHTDDLKIRNITVTSFDTKKYGLSKLEVKNFTQQEKYQFLNIEMNEPLEPKTNVTITISYTGSINQDIKGLYRNSYKVHNETRWVLGTQMEPTFARNVFPCFDEPALRAVFQISVVVPKNYTAISNMPIKTITKGAMYEFEKTPSMPTYLVAIVVSDFVNLTMKDGNRTYAVWAQSQLAHQLPYSLSVIPKAIDFFEKRLGIPYPLPKVDMVAFPDFPGEAMENWGLQLYSEILMLDEPTATPLYLKRYIRNLVTHEHAHQWFGNLVTLKWWDYLWLNEGFAQYFEYHAHEDELSSWNLESQFVAKVMHEAFAYDADESTHPITNKVYSPSQIGAIFDAISYSKAGCVIRMFEKVLGSEIFYGALRRYLKKSKYSTGTPELLIEAFEQEIKSNNYKLHASVAEVMNTWTVQSGFPVVNVQFDGDTVAIKQKRFFLMPPKNVTFNTAWCIPINWATQSKPDFDDTKNVIWVRDNFTSLPIVNASEDWVIFNIQQTGFYRVNYDNEMWRRIIAALKSSQFERIHEINRASLLDDLFNLGRVGEVGYDVVFNATQYLERETNYVPWRAAFNGFTYLKNRLVGRPELYHNLKAYIISLLDPIYQKLGFNEKNGESHYDALLRKHVLTWLCSLDHQDCIDRAWSAFNNLQKNETFVISPNQQGFIYCTVVKHGSTKEYNYLWRKFQKSVYSIERHTILKALACSQNSSNIKTLLIDVLTLNHDIKQEQLSELIITIAKNNKVGLATVLNYVEYNFDELVDNIDDEGTVQSIVKFISEQLSTEEQVSQFDSIVKNHPHIPGISESMKLSLENAVYDLNRIKEYSQTIERWLGNNVLAVKKREKLISF